MSSKAPGRVFMQLWLRTAGLSHTYKGTMAENSSVAFLPPLLLSFTRQAEIERYLKIGIPGLASHPCTEKTLPSSWDNRHAPPCQVEPP